MCRSPMSTDVLIVIAFLDKASDLFVPSDFLLGSVNPVEGPIPPSIQRSRGRRRRIRLSKGGGKTMTDLLLWLVNFGIILNGID